MSVKYGESKKQYVMGRRVKNLEVYVDLDKVCVKWEEIEND